MINIAHKIEKGMGVRGINYYVTDYSKPIDALKGQEGKFGLVLGNWLLNDLQRDRPACGATSPYILKPGGKFISTFTCFDPNTRGLATGKYGARGKDHGAHYRWEGVNISLRL
jgi:hypothetical protein